MSLRRALPACLTAIAMASLGAGCPTDVLVDPLRISEVHFEQTVVAPGQTIAISAAVSGEFDGSPTIEWSVDAGELSVTDALETTWTAPETNQLVAIQLVVTVNQPGLEEPNQRAFETDLIVGTGIDHDGDGYSIGEGDCDDTNGSIYPGAPDLADGLDNDCDGILDEGSPDFDDDGDGFADIEGDCNDGDILINPAAEERINDLDDDCDGTVDEGTDAYDDDGDGFAENDEPGDCNDLTSAVSPDADEILDGVDNDCDGTVDEGTAAYDDDGDGYTELQGDCDDDPLGAGTAASPAELEIPDGIDNDCNGIVDDGDFATDDDGDGWSELAGDCDDNDAYTYPGAPEYSDTLDNDCNGIADDGMDTFDDDGDNWSESQGDCDDYNAAVYPGAPEIADSPIDYDNDCDGFGFVNPPFAVAVSSAGPYDTCNEILLDGSQSWDPDGDSFIYYWYFAWQPINSSLDTPNINNGSSSNADFQPDVPGLWIVGLLTNDDMFNSVPAFLEFDVLDGGVCP